jgi:hypothetical protein
LRWNLRPGGNPLRMEPTYRGPAGTAPPGCSRPFPGDDTGEPGSRNEIKRSIVLGATGIVGSHIVDQLVQAGERL